eukprot:jgi/Mesvir1/17305/Mv07704-RA.3
MGDLARASAVPEIRSRALVSNVKMGPIAWTAALLAVVLIAGPLPLAYCATKTFTFKVSYQFRSPACVEKPIVVVNGLYPGPVIDVNYGDDVVVTVVNGLYTEETSIHFHGMFQNGTVWFDGTHGVTQCGIPVDSSMTYRFKAEPVGTHWWHSHVGLQKMEGIVGAIIVRGNDHYGEDEEFPPIVLSDWWLASARNQLVGLLASPTFRFPGNPDALLINGVGLANCAGLPAAYTCVAACASAYQPVTWNVIPGRTYRLRIINAGNLVMMNFAIAGHQLTVVAQDGFAVKPYAVNYLDINGGQRFDLLLTANQLVDNYWVSVITRFRPGPPTYGVVHYDGAPAALPSAAKPVGGAPLPLQDDLPSAYAFSRLSKALNGPPGGVPAPTKKIFIVSTQMRVDGYLRWGLNNVSDMMPATPYLHQHYFDKVSETSIFSTTPPGVWDFQLLQTAEGVSINGLMGPSTTTLNYGDVVELVIQNTLALNGAAEQHPWHLHGHHMYIMAYGQGNYNPSVDDATFNTVDPPLQDTFSMLPRGWTAVRFVANNPGAWAFHCHIEPHLMMGMGTVFVVAPERIPEPPADMFLCGEDVTMSTVVQATLNDFDMHDPGKSGKHAIQQISTDLQGMLISRQVTNSRILSTLREVISDLDRASCTECWYTPGLPGAYPRVVTNRGALLMAVDGSLVLALVRR